MRKILLMLLILGCLLVFVSACARNFSSSSRVEMADSAGGDQAKPDLPACRHGQARP